MKSSSSLGSLLQRRQSWGVQGLPELTEMLDIEQLAPGAPEGAMCASGEPLEAGLDQHWPVELSPGMEIFCIWKYIV